MFRDRLLILLSAAFLLCLAGPAPVSHAQTKDDDIIKGEATVIDAGTLQIGDKVVKLDGVRRRAATWSIWFRTASCSA
jgi:hypothetical protein